MPIEVWRVVTYNDDGSKNPSVHYFHSLDHVKESVKITFSQAPTKIGTFAIRPVRFADKDAEDYAVWVYTNNHDYEKVAVEAERFVINIDNTPTHL